MAGACIKRIPEKWFRFSDRNMHGNKDLERGA